MDDTNAKHCPSRNLDLGAKKLGSWQAALQLNFNVHDGRSFLERKHHIGPLVIQKSLHPEGPRICHGIIVHPPGGVAGGDQLSLQVHLAEGSNALLTTPGAGKWYKANGEHASQSLQFNVAESACLEWLPQENILFDGAMVELSAEVNLAKNAKFAGWEILCFGRLAKGERWDSGKLKQGLSIKRTNKLLWQERTNLLAGDRFFQSIVGLGGKVVSASFLIAAGPVPPELLLQCQQLQTQDAGKVSEARWGVTALPDIVSARYVGMSAPAARQYFENLWHILRPWYLDQVAVNPRIWQT